MADEVDTRLPLDLDPEIIPSMDYYDEDTRPVLEGAVGLIRSAHSALLAVHDAKAAAATDPTLNESAQLLKVDDFAKAKMGPVTQAWDKVSATLENNIKQFEAELSAPVVAKASAVVSGEIRSFFKGLDTGERFTAIREAIRAGDEVSVSAILGAPPYFSGLTTESQDEFLREWAAKVNPIVSKSPIRKLFMHSNTLQFCG